MTQVADMSRRLKNIELKRKPLEQRRSVLKAGHDSKEKERQALLTKIDTMTKSIESIESEMNSLDHEIERLNTQN